MSAQSRTADQQPLYARLWFQVIVGIVVGVGLGYFYPAQGAAMKPLGDAILKLLSFSLLFGLAVLHMGKVGKQLVSLIDQFPHGLLGMVGLIMYVSAIGAFGARAYTIGQFGIATLLSLGQLMLAMVGACLF